MRQQNMRPCMSIAFSLKGKWDDAVFGIIVKFIGFNWFVPQAAIYQTLFSSKRKFDMSASLRVRRVFWLLRIVQYDTGRWRSASGTFFKQKWGKMIYFGLSSWTSLLLFLFLLSFHPEMNFVWKWNTDIWWLLMHTTGWTDSSSVCIETLLSIFHRRLIHYCALIIIL